MTIGERIREVRTAKGMTQKQVADACGMADSAIRKYESGQITPKYATLQRIAAALSVPVDSLIDDPNRFDVEDIKDAIIYGGPIGRVVENMQQLNLAGRQRVEAYSADMLQIAAYREDGLQPPQQAPESTPSPQVGKDTTPASDAPGTAPEGE